MKKSFVFHKRAIIFGGAGFIGHHLARKLKNNGYWVKIVDIKTPEISLNEIAHEFVLGDLQDYNTVYDALNIGHSDIEIYQLAADMGGAGYIFTGENDANIMSNSVLINLNTLKAMVELNLKKVFFSSSACVYPEETQLDVDNPDCREASAYPANPDSEYGWEKLFSERLYMAYNKNYGIECRIARFHNIYGPEGTWRGGKEKSPAALCRKVLEAPDNGEIEIWGDGKQTRSFLYIDECLEGIERLMNSNYSRPINIGSEEMISINDFAKMIIDISDKKITIKNIAGPLGVRGRSSENTLINQVLGWTPNYPLIKGIEYTYRWIYKQIHTH
jgi:nucleoside-diphosphate-sugar epimerase